MNRRSFLKIFGVGAVAVGTPSVFFFRKPKALPPVKGQPCQNEGVVFSPPADHTVQVNGDLVVNGDLSVSGNLKVGGATHYAPDGWMITSVNHHMDAHGMESDVELRLVGTLEANGRGAFLMSGHENPKNLNDYAQQVINRASNPFGAQVKLGEGHDIEVLRCQVEQSSPVQDVGHGINIFAGRAETTIRARVRHIDPENKV